ncbi:MAG: hypothetical protein GX790_02655 [Syntrophomonadaceae bacterium]|nr:hypothetical protein [Syntrophomonadaceae bacterium]
MSILHSLKSNIEQNLKLWIILWLLLLLNAFTFFSLSRGFSFWLCLVFLLIALICISILIQLAQVPQEKPIEILEEVKADVDELMKEIKPLCEEIFNRETTKVIDPFMEDLQKDFFKGINWLWENIDDFITMVQDNLGDVDTILQLFTTVTEEKHKLAQDLMDSVGAIDQSLLNLHKSKEKDFILLSENLDIKKSNLIAGLEKEKELFYEYIYKVLIEQSQNEEDFDPTEHFNTYKLGDQFAGIVEKSMESRLSSFHETTIEFLEDFSSDVVGRMQKNVNQLLNAFRDNQVVLEKLLNECRSENNLLIRRINELLEKNSYLQEKASEILVTLAWQDILVEKRWQEIKEKLYLVKDLVENNVDAEVFDYIKEVVDKEVPGISYMIKQADGAVFYKNLLDAELVYQVYQGQKLKDVLENGVQVLLQYIRPVEMLINSSIRLNEYGLKLRKNLAKRTKAGEFNETFNKVISLVEQDNPKLNGYLDNLFPKAFISFCNSPYVKKKPDSLNIAAWSIFLSLIDNENNNDEIYILVGLLLVAHELRNRYIHPFKSSLIQLEDEDQIDIIRYITYRLVNLIIRNELKGTTSMSYKYK